MSSCTLCCVYVWLYPLLTVERAAGARRSSASSFVSMAVQLGDVITALHAGLAKALELDSELVHSSSGPSTGSPSSSSPGSVLNCIRQLVSVTPYQRMGDRTAARLLADMLAWIVRHHVLPLRAHKCPSSTTRVVLPVCVAMLDTACSVPEVLRLLSGRPTSSSAASAENAEVYEPADESGVLLVPTLLEFVFRSLRFKLSASDEQDVAKARLQCLAVLSRVAKRYGEVLLPFWSKPSGGDEHKTNRPNEPIGALSLHGLLTAAARSNDAAFVRAVLRVVNEWVNCDVAHLNDVSQRVPVNLLLEKSVSALCDRAQREVALEASAAPQTVTPAATLKSKGRPAKSGVAFRAEDFGSVVLNVLPQVLEKWSPSQADKGDAPVVGKVLNCLACVPESLWSAQVRLPVVHARCTGTRI